MNILKIKDIQAREPTNSISRIYKKETCSLTRNKRPGQQKKYRKPSRK